MDDLFKYLRSKRRSNSTAPKRFDEWYVSTVYLRLGKELILLLSLFFLG